MASNINPNNIDGAYPVAGQDNDSQGFRDNFTNIKTNFQYAEDEITDLQNNAILKSALAGTTLNNDMNGSLIYNYQSQDVSETVVSLGTTSGSVTINYAAGSIQTVTTAGNISFALSNWPAAGLSGKLKLIVTVASSTHTLTFPAAVNINSSGIMGWNTSTNVFSARSAGTYTFYLSSINGGSNVMIESTSNLLNPWSNTSEDLSNGAAASLATTTSYFSTTAPETATLAAGVNGQIKVFCMVADGGDMVITVTNAGWKSSGTGTISFTDIGDSCILQYINNKWFVVGSNDVAFA
jgi:hypothetical protein